MHFTSHLHATTPKQKLLKQNAPIEIQQKLMCAEGTVVESLNERTCIQKDQDDEHADVCDRRADTAPHFCRDLKKRITVVASQLNRHPMEAALTRMVSFEIRLTTRKESHWP